MKDLFIFEMANNHQGSVEHGFKIIAEMSKIAKKHKLKAAIKLQYRQLESFIHPSFKNDTNAKHISRFNSTKLTQKEFKSLINEIKKNDLLTVVTPFDEESVDVIDSHNVDIIKIASCSADDWPLIERIVKSKKPIIASTAGLELWQIDNLVSYLTHNCNDVSILHCVGLYPTPNDNLNLNFIDTLKERYPYVKIGYSGHEAPNNTEVIKVAKSKGAKIFERHVGVPTDSIKLNGYSMNPQQTDELIKSYCNIRTILGDRVKKNNKQEKDSLLSLKRGVFARKAIKKGDKIRKEDIFYAMPCKENQLNSGNFGTVRAEFYANKDYKKNEAIFESWDIDIYHKIRKIIHEAKGRLYSSKIEIGKDYTIELSHHYGIEKFYKFGCLIVNLINREYCKKIIVVFSKQSHPEQKHLKKEETFHVLEGDVNLVLNGISHSLKKGEIKTIERGVLHSFSSENGAIIEEISTTHFRSDSFYTDPLISKQDPMQRKTIISKF